MLQAVVRGWFDVECVNPDGSVAWRKRAPNGAATVGLNSLLDVGFGAAAQIAAWYMGVIDNSGYTALAAADTMSSHAGWSESTAYTESTRQQWSPGSASGGIITNSSAAVFTVNAAVTVRGAFITSSSTKGGTTGTLWATGLLESTESLVSGQQLRITYTTQLVGGTG